MKKSGKTAVIKKVVPARKRGRPTKYTPELAEAICKAVIDNKSLAKICETIQIDIHTLYHWLDAHEDFLQQYARAREIQTQLWEDRILQAAWDNSDDDLFTEDGKRFENKEWTSRSKLKVDALKWLMSKRLPKKYGDRLNLDSQEKMKVSFTFGGEEDGDSAKK
jgi:Bacteriophage Sf6, terminase small subunit-like